MDKFEMEEQKQEFFGYIDELRKSDRPGYIAVCCMIEYLSGRAEPMEALRTASRGDFKRAIKALRSAQNEYPDRELLDEVVAHIRRRWLPRNETPT